MLVLPGEALDQGWCTDIGVVTVEYVGFNKE